MSYRCPINSDSRVFRLALHGLASLLLSLCLPISSFAAPWPSLAAVTQTTADGTVALVIPDDPYEYWKQNNFSVADLNTPGVSDPLATPSGDGSPNLLKYFQGLGPRSTDRSGQPFATLEPGGLLSLRYYRDKKTTDVDHFVEYSTDVQHWFAGDEALLTSEVIDLGGRESIKTIAPFSQAIDPFQYLRLQAIRPSRADFLRTLTALNDSPAQLLADSVISTVPAGPMQGAVTRYPRRYGYPNYVVNWYFANIGLYHFVDTQRAAVKNHLAQYLARLKPDFTIRDVDIRADLQTVLTYELAADSDDAYAGSYLRLVSKFALTYPDDPFFAANLAVLKNIADKNIVNQIKGNNLVRVFQNGRSATGASNDTGYLMDNVEAWAGLSEFVQALIAINATADAAVYQAARDRLLGGIHAQLWDATLEAWKWADGNATATSSVYYPDLMCQYFPQLHGLPHPSGEAETLRRYDAAWHWLEIHKPDWWKAGAWTPDPVDTHRHEVSDLALALVASKRSQWEHSRAYMALAIRNWAPDFSRPATPIPGMLVSEIGYWQALLKGAVVSTPAITPFTFTDQSSVAAGTPVNSNTVILGGFSGSLTAFIPVGATLYVNGVARAGSSVSVMGGDTLWLEATSSSLAGVTRTFTLKVGDHSATWSVTAAGVAAVPDQPGAASGYTPLEASVSESGGAQVSLPILVSPGTAGMQPKLAIAYSSQGGNGPLGLGFCLNGLSGISRAGRSIAQDSTKGGINFDANERFVLDGQRLIAIAGLDGADGTEYRLEFDRGTRIHSYGNMGGGPDHWVVENKAGLSMSYGRQIYAFQPVPQTLSPPVSWALDSVTDTLGNRMQFEYDGVAAARGELLVTRIAYTSNAAAGLTAAQEVVFAYEDRPDPSIGCIQGYQVQYLKRLGQIESHARGLANTVQVVRSYALSYQQDALTNDSQLVTVVESTTDGTALPATQFTWPASNAAEPFFPQALSTSVTSAHNVNFEFITGDFDGDGKTDVLAWKANAAAPSGVATRGFFSRLFRDKKFKTVSGGGQFVLYHSNGAGFDAPRATPLTGGDNAPERQIVAGDFDGDGKLDLLAWREAENKYVVYYSSPSGVDFQSPVGTAIPLSTADHPIISADFNGDGRTDLLVWNYPGLPSEYSLLLAEETHFQTAIPTGIQSTTGNQDAVVSGEFNGDGMADLLIWNAAGVHYDIYLATGQGFAPPIATGVPNAFSTTDSNIEGDFNGDGLTDIMVWDLPSNPGKYTLYRCLGSGFGAPIVTNVTGGQDGVDNVHQNVVDFNGDGKTDVITWNTPSQNSRYNITLSSGAGYRPPCATAIPALSSMVLPGDFNGDGKTDLLVFDTPEAGKCNLWLNQGPQPRLLQHVSNGHGAYTNFTYKPLTDSSVHTIGVPAFYPSMSVAAPLHVVSAMTSSNANEGDPFTGGATGIPAENTMSYTYYGAWATATGRGFQGFSAMIVADGSTGILTSTDYVIDPLLAGHPGHVEQRLGVAPAGGSALLSAGDSTWIADTTTWPNGNKTYFVHEVTSVTRQYESNRPAATALIKTTTSSGSTYDDYGNLTHSYVAHGGGFTEENTNTYNNLTNGVWILGRLATASVTRTAPGTPALTRSSSFGYNATTGLLTSETIEPGGGALRLDKTYAHDAFGNILTSTFSAAGEPARGTATAYSGDGRFLLTTTNALGHSESKTYDPLLGNVLTQTGPNGLTTSCQYDFLGRPIRELRPDGTEMRSFYRRVTGATTGTPPRAVHYVITQSSGSAPRTTWYDLLDREIRMDGIAFDGRRVSTHRAFNAEGTLLASSDPYFEGDPPQYTIARYDKALRVIEEIAPGNRTTVTEYDGLTATVTNSLLQKATTVVNVMGWTVQSTDNANQSITKSYDAYGNLRFVTDPANHVTELRYDARGYKIWMSEPNTGVSSFDYNAYGELVSQADAKGQITTIVHDKLGRVTQRTEASGVSSFTYDIAPKGIGQLAGEAGPGFARYYYYDALSRPSSSVEAHGASTFAISRSYDSYGRPETLTYPTGFTVRQVYNSNGQLAAVQNGVTGLKYWKADAINARGQITEETLGNGIHTVRRFNIYTGLIEVITGSNNAQGEAYTFDSIGNLTGRQDTRFANPFVETFTYDNLNRLKIVAAINSTAVTVNYDGIGNITNRSDVGTFSYGAGGVGPHAVTAVTGVAAKNCAYDSNGNRTADGGTVIAYSSFNKPLSIVKASDALYFAYAPDRSLYHQSTSHIDSSGPLMATERDYVAGLYELETTLDGRVQHTHYIAGGSGVVAIYTEEQSAGKSTQRTRYVLKDHLGSVAAVCDSDGAVIERLSFDAWGRRRSLDYTGGAWTILYTESLGGKETHRGFTGHEMLDALALVHMGGRVYDPMTARFLSPDPFVQSPDDLQNLNRYGYVLNNPLSLTDPSGLRWKPFRKIQRLFHQAVKVVVQQAAGAVGATIGFVIGGPQGAAAGYGFGVSFSGTLMAGGNIGDALRAGLVSAVSSYFASVVGDEFSKGGAFADFARFKSVAHGVVQGAIRQASGGDFKHAFLSATFADISGGYTKGIDGAFARTAIAAVVGGTAEALGGGKFGNGAVTATFVHLFNAELHSSSGPRESVGFGGTAYVGGFFDAWSTGPMLQEFRGYAYCTVGANASYFTWDQALELAAWIQENGTGVTVIGHSYGADTAMSVVADGNRVNRLITLDPVGWSRPDFGAARANATLWDNVNAIGGSIFTPSNIIAGFGGAYNDATRGYSQMHEANVDHANVPGMLDSIR
jgi:RHS repeat-associated protein